MTQHVRGFVSLTWSDRGRPLTRTIEVEFDRDECVHTLSITTSALPPTYPAYPPGTDQSGVAPRLQSLLGGRPASEYTTGLTNEGTTP